MRKNPRSIHWVLLEGKNGGWGLGRRPWREQFPEKTGGEGEEAGPRVPWVCSDTKHGIRMGRSIVIKPGGHPLFLNALNCTPPVPQRPSLRPESQ